MEITGKEKVLAIQIEAIIKQVQIIERFGAHLAMHDACETIAGVMYEQGELISLAHNSYEKELKDWANKYEEKQGRFYSGHFAAIRDALRLCKLVSELIEQTNEFVENGGINLLETIQERRMVLK